MVTRVADCALCSGTAPAHAIVELSFDGVEYEIPVCSAHEGVTRALFAPALDKKDLPKASLWADGSAPPVKKAKAARKPSSTGRPVGRPPKDKTKPAAKPARKSGKLNLADVRDWAWNKGFEVGERGRIPQDIIDAYTKTQK